MGIRKAWPLMPVLAGLTLAACGHDHHDDFFDSVDPSGVYEGSLTDTVTQTATPVVAVVDENGDGRMMAQNGTYYALGLNSSGNNVLGPYLAFPGDGTTTSGSLSGQLQNSGAILSATLKATGADPLALNLNFDNVYYTPSSLPTLQGNWVAGSGTSNEPANGSGFSLDLSIEATGAFNGTDSNDCTYSGFFNVVDTQFDAYSESFSTICGSTTTKYFGLSYYIPATGTGSSAMPAMIEFLADDDNGHFVAANVPYSGPLVINTSTQ